MREPSDYLLQCMKNQDGLPRKNWQEVVYDLYDLYDLFPESFYKKFLQRNFQN